MLVSVIGSFFLYDVSSNAIDVVGTKNTNAVLVDAAVWTRGAVDIADTLIHARKAVRRGFYVKVFAFVNCEDVRET